MPKRKKTHLDEMIEWQRHQYNPGHYTGGRLHPFFKARGRPGLPAVWMYVMAGLFALIFFVNYVSNPDFSFFNLPHLPSLMIVSLIFCSIFIYFIYGSGVKTSVHGEIILANTLVMWYNYNKEMNIYGVLRNEFSTK